MTKILQIRRGTTTEIENFIGAAGEITMDTDAKTIRVHDGNVPGGHEIARADLSNIDPNAIAAAMDNIDLNANSFDMNTVPSGFWENLFQEYKGDTRRFAANPGIDLDWIGTGTNTLNTSIGGMQQPIDMIKIVIDSVLLCKSTDAGYGIDETVQMFGIGDRTTPVPVVYEIRNNGIGVRMWIGPDDVWVLHKTTGVKTNVNKTKWKLIFRAWF